MKKKLKWTKEYKREYMRNYMRVQRENKRKIYIFRLRNPESIISKDESELFNNEDYIYINSKGHEIQKQTRESHA